MTQRRINRFPGADGKCFDVATQPIRRSPAVLLNSAVPDSFKKMWCAFVHALVNGKKAMYQPFHCATPAETLSSHDIMTAAI